MLYSSFREVLKKFEMSIRNKKVLKQYPVFKPFENVRFVCIKLTQFLSICLVSKVFLEKAADSTPETTSS